MPVLEFGSHRIALALSSSDAAGWPCIRSNTERLSPSDDSECLDAVDLTL